MEAGLDAFLASFRLRTFQPGQVLVFNTYGQTDVQDRVARVAYIRQGLVRGAWHRALLAPLHDTTTIVAGDRRWVGLDAFKYGENLFRYTALARTTAHVVPFQDLVERAPREVLLDALEGMSLAWCTASSVLSLSGLALDRRVMLLLYNVSRIHPRRKLELPQKVVADLVGVSRQALNPVLKRLERRGFVSLGYGALTIQQPSRLIDELRRTATEQSDTGT
jgi:hypothetical protein